MAPGCALSASLRELVAARARQTAEQEKEAPATSPTASVTEQESNP